MKIKAFRIMRAKQNGSLSPSTDLQDMLRYDCAFIAENQEHFPRIIVFPRFVDRRGTFAGNITHAKWGTYHIYLNPCSIQCDNEVVDHIKRHPESWITYQHPYDEHGITLYRTLAEFSLLDWQIAPRIDDVYTFNNRYCSKHLAPMRRLDKDTLYQFQCEREHCDSLCYVPK